MTKSELQRILLYRGHDDMADYLRNSPFNRCIYSVILRHGPKQLPVDMLTLFKEGAFAEVGDKTCRVNFAKLHNGIIANVYHQVAEQEVSFEEGMGQTYKEQLEELKLKYQELEESQEFRIKEIEAQHQAELWDLRVKLEEKELAESQRSNAKALLFTFTEMAEIVKKRFSKAGAEEFSNMLYNLTTKHGFLDEEISKAIDGIVAAVIEREKGSTTVHIPTAQQVNINPQQVTNTFNDDEKR